MRLTVTPVRHDGKEGFAVRADLYNVSEKEIPLRSAWRDDSVSGGVKEYLEAAIHIETVPEIAPWVGGVRQGHRTAPQTDQVIKSGEVLSLEWKSEGRRLKNHVTDPGAIQNPEFPFPGLYSVHASVEVVTPDRTIFLRSNEVLVSVGESLARPKHTYGRFIDREAERKTGTLNLGAREMVKIGDRFLIGYAKTGQWRMTITEVFPHWSIGRLEPMPVPAGFVEREPRFPERLAPAPGHTHQKQARSYNY